MVLSSAIMGNAFSYSHVALFISCEKYVVILRNHVFHPYVYISGSQFALWTGGVSITSEHITNENLGVLSQPD